MISLTLCEACDKKTNSLRQWFGKFLCPKYYEAERSKQQTILISNLND